MDTNYLYVDSNISFSFFSNNMGNLDLSAKQFPIININEIIVILVNPIKLF